MAEELHRECISIQKRYLTEEIVQNLAGHVPPGLNRQPSGLTFDSPTLPNIHAALH